MKRYDWIVIILIIVIFVGVNYKSYKNVQSVSILVDGIEIASLELKNIEYKYVVENQYGKNVLLIDDTGVRVIWADCTSQTCVNFGKITHSNQVIACLPHHLIITMEGEVSETKELDAVTH